MAAVDCVATHGSGGAGRGAHGSGGRAYIATDPVTDSTAAATNNLRFFIRCLLVTRAALIFCSTYSCANLSEKWTWRVNCPSLPSRACGRRLIGLESVICCPTNGRGKAGAMSGDQTITALLAEWASGNRQALDDLTARLYSELRELQIPSCAGKWNH